MNSETIKTLKESVPFKEFTDHISEQMKNLDTITDIEDAPSGDIALEALSRKRAYDTLQAILDPVLDFKDNNNNKADDYIV